MKKLLLSVIAAAATGCSIHPLPKDVTREYTRDIAYKIRCEARDSIRLMLIELFDSSRDPDTKSLSVKLSDPSFVFGKIKNNQLDKATLSIIEKFRGSAIAYNFRFKITENNKNSSGATFKLPFSEDLFSLALKAGKDKTRETERTFKISESFDKISNLEKCHNFDTVDENWVYPIAGKIGMHEVIKTFIGLANDNGLSGAFSDKLTYTTKIFGSADPKITLSPIADEFTLTEANLSLLADRNDIHEVTVALILPSPKPDVLEFKLPDPRAKIVVNIPKREITRAPVARPSQRSFLSAPQAQEDDAEKRALQELERLETISIQRDIQSQLDE